MLLCLVAALAAVAFAQPRTGVAGRQYIFCTCSLTGRGFRNSVLEELQDGIAKLDESSNEMRRDGVNTRRKTAKLVLESQELWQACVDNYSLEECVNADTKLRVQAACAPNCASFCEYDRGTWRNNANGRYGPKCTSKPEWSSQEQVIIDGKFPPEEVTKTPTNPNPAPERPLAASIQTRPDAPRPAAGGTSPSKPGTPIITPAVNPPKRPPPPPSHTVAPARPAKPVSPARPASPAKPAAHAPPVPQNTNTGPVNAGNANAGATTPIGPDGGDSSIPPDVDLFAPEPPPTPGSPGEGCVAAEHLRGYVLQHDRHLWRYVLCSRGFCATPNHALIVDGTWTSMKRLCAGTWRCVATRRYVNNLRVTGNRRALVGDIIVTPYDLRYPRWAVWVVQIAEMVLRAVAAPLALLALLVGMLRYRAFRRERYASPSVHSKTV